MAKIQHKEILAVLQQAGATVLRVRSASRFAFVRTDRRFRHEWLDQDGRASSYPSESSPHGDRIAMRTNCARSRRTLGRVVASSMLTPTILLCGYTLQAIDDDLGWKGFAAAMQSIGWLRKSDGDLLAPQYDEHNGPSAKRRASEETEAQGRKPNRCWRCRTKI